MFCFKMGYDYVNLMPLEKMTLMIPHSLQNWGSTKKKAGLKFNLFVHIYLLRWSVKYETMGSSLDHSPSMSIKDKLL